MNVICDMPVWQSPSSGVSPYSTALFLFAKKNRKHLLTQKELTEFVEEVILVLKEELSDGYLTEVEYHDYIRLFHFGVDRVLRQHPQMQEEVYRMTEPLIKLPSMIIKELQTEIADQKMALDGIETELRRKDTELQDKEAEIKRLQKLVEQLSSDRHMPVHF